MPIYKYVATNSVGTRVTGSVDSRSKEQALSLIKNKGLFVISIEEKGGSFLDKLSFTGISSSEIVGFTRQFSTMISAGLPLSRALEVLTNQTQNHALKTILYDVLKSVEGGVSLSSALSRHTQVFSPTYQALVAAGESSGTLDIILARLANKMEAERELDSRFKGAMIYPAIVLLAMVGVFFILMIFVIPKLAEMYRNLNVPLPVITQIMIAVSDFLSKNVLLVLVAMVGGALAFRAFAKSEQGRIIFTEISFMLPVFGKINKMKEIEQFTSTLALLMSSAVPIVESLNIVSKVMVSTSFKKAAVDASVQIEKGKEMSAYFNSNPLFPPLVGQMANVGQETGKMDEVLEKVAEYFRGEVDHLVRGLSAALEPLILVMLGTLVGFLIISIITPIYKITSAL